MTTSTYRANQSLPSQNGRFSTRAGGESLATYQQSHRPSHHLRRLPGYNHCTRLPRHHLSTFFTRTTTASDLSPDGFLRRTNGTTGVLLLHRASHTLLLSLFAVSRGRKEAHGYARISLHTQATAQSTARPHHDKSRMLNGLISNFTRKFNGGST